MKWRKYKSIACFADKTGGMKWTANRRTPGITSTKYMNGFGLKAKKI